MTGRRRVRLILVTLALSLSSLSREASSTRASPYSVSPGVIRCDEDLGTIFGIVADIGLDETGHVYLLDRQLFNVHVLDTTRDGPASVSSVGRQGEGPGEFWAPSALAIRDDGALTVFQGFHAPGVAFDELGRIAGTVDLASVRDGFANTYIHRAEQLDDGSYVLQVTRIRIDAAKAIQHEFTNSSELVYLSRDGSRQEVLLSTDERRASRWQLSRLSSEAKFIPSWDVAGVGQFVFADGPSNDSLTFFSLSEDGVSTRRLAISPEVEAATARIEVELGIEPGTAPRVGQVNWLEPGQSVVIRTSAEMHREQQGRTWVEVETRDLGSGASSVVELSINDSSEDLVTLSKGRVVVVDGAARGRADFFANVQKMLGSDTGASEIDGRAGVSIDEKVCIRIFELPRPR